MATTLTFPAVGINFTGTLADTSRLGAPTSAIVQDATPSAYTVGTNAGNVAFEYSSTLSIGTNATTLDLTSLLDPLGNAIVFTKVVAFKVTNNSTSTSNVTIGGGSNPLFAAYPVTAQGGSGGIAGCVAYSSGAGLTVTGASTNNFKLISDVAATSTTITILGH